MSRFTICLTYFRRELLSAFGHEAEFAFGRLEALLASARLFAGAHQQSLKFGHTRFAELTGLKLTPEISFLHTQ